MSSESASDHVVCRVQVVACDLEYDLDHECLHNLLLGAPAWPGLPPGPLS